MKEDKNLVVTNDNEVKENLDNIDNTEKKKRIRIDMLAVICIIIYCFACAPKRLQNDTFYTIKIGELIAETNTVDMKDHFSWHEDLPYTYPHWLYDLGIYGIFHLGEVANIGGDAENSGMTFVYASTVILTCVLGLLIYFTGKKVSKSQIISFIVTIFAMYLLRSYIAARAQLLTFSCFVLEILLIESFLESKKKRYLIGLVLDSILIANVHAAVWPFFFVLFLPYVVEFIIAEVVDATVITNLKVIYREVYQSYLETKVKRLKKKSAKKGLSINETKKMMLYEMKIENLTVKIGNLYNKMDQEYEKIQNKRKNPYKLKVIKNRAVLWLLGTLVICVLVGFITPIGDTPFTYLEKTMSGETTKSISEHLPLTLIDNKTFMVVLAAYFVVLIFTDAKIRCSDLFMLAGLIYLSFMSRRQISMFIIIAFFIFEKLFKQLVDKYASDIGKKIKRFSFNILGKIVILCVIILFAWSLYKPMRNDDYIDTVNYPKGACDWIIENLDYKNIKLFNEYNYGSYLIYRGIPVFIDSRADLYAPEFNGTKDSSGKYSGRNIFGDYINTSNISVYYETKMEKYDISHVICYNDCKLNMFLSRDDNYRQLYKDKKFVVYERVNGAEKLRKELEEKKNEEAQLKEQEADKAQMNENAGEQVAENVTENVEVAS